MYSWQKNMFLLISVYRHLAYERRCITVHNIILSTIYTLYLIVNDYLSATGCIFVLRIIICITLSTLDNKPSIDIDAREVCWPNFLPSRYCSVYRRGGTASDRNNGQVFAVGLQSALVGRSIAPLVTSQLRWHLSTNKRNTSSLFDNV